MPGWQEVFERYRKLGFTVVGIALDAEGIAPAKLYYEKFGVTFPALVDPNYATGFGAVPQTFFVDEYGVVQSLRNWEKRLKPADQLESVTDDVRSQWTLPGQRLDPASIARLVAAHTSDPPNLTVAGELASRYLDLNLAAEAKSVLQTTLKHYEPLKVARSKDKDRSRLLGQAYLQLSRSFTEDQDAQVKYATLSFYLNPSVGFGKQIARIIAPEKFDGRPKGDFDNRFREGTLRRLRTERQAWLQED